MNTWKVILATMVIFATGVVTGGMLTWRVQRMATAQRARTMTPRMAQPPAPGGMRMEFLRRAQRDLDLSPGQRERIDRVLKESQERNRKLMEPVAPLLRQELERTKQLFRQELTPAQQKRFDELVRKSTHQRDPRSIPSAAPSTNKLHTQ